MWCSTGCLSFLLAGGHGSGICHFHQHHGWRTGGDGLSTVLCSAFALTTTQMECQEPAAFRAEYWLPVAYRFFCLIGRGNACCAYVRREPGIYVLSGDDGVGAFGIACYYIPFVFMVGNAIAQSAQPIISYNFGLGYKERVMTAERIALLTAVVCGVVATVAFTVYPYLLVGIFISLDSEAAKIAIHGFPYFASGFVFSL